MVPIFSCSFHKCFRARILVIHQNKMYLVFISDKCKKARPPFPSCFCPGDYFVRLWDSWECVIFKVFWFIDTPKNLIPISVQVENIFHGLACAEVGSLSWAKAHLISRFIHSHELKLMAMKFLSTNPNLGGGTVLPCCVSILWWSSRSRGRIKINDKFI